MLHQSGRSSCKRRHLHLRTYDITECIRCSFIFIGTGISKLIRELPIVPRCFSRYNQFIDSVCCGRYRISIFWIRIIGIISRIFTACRSDVDTSWKCFICDNSELSCCNFYNGSQWGFHFALSFNMGNDLLFLNKYWFWE